MYDPVFRKPSIAFHFLLSAFVAMCLSSASDLGAQSVDAANTFSNPAEPREADFPAGEVGAPTELVAELPNAPEPAWNVFSGSTSAEPGAAPPARTPRFAPKPRAPLYDKYIEPSQRAQPLTGLGNKLYFGVHQIVSPYFVVAVVSAAGYEQAINGSPNFGTGGDAFVQRLGAAAARNASQSIFTDGLMPAVFHQDPRYYVMGKSHNALARGTYAVSRVFITRSDGGRSVPNYSLFAGHAETSILENAYYPDVNRSVTETAKGFAGSFAGAALSNAIREFFPDILHLAHLE